MTGPILQHIPARLIATLRTEPQVVTAALDLLRGQREWVDRTLVLHAVSPGTPVVRAVSILQEMFSGSKYRERFGLELVSITE